MTANVVTISGANMSAGEAVGTYGEVIVANAGTNSAGSAPVLTALGAVSGTAIQLSDVTRDYLVYLEVTTAGTATSVTIGHTSSANDAEA